MGVSTSFGDKREQHRRSNYNHEHTYETQENLATDLRICTPMGCFHSTPENLDVPLYVPRRAHSQASLESFLRISQRQPLRNGTQSNRNNDEQLRSRDICLCGDDCPWREANSDDYMHAYLNGPMPHLHNSRNTDREMRNYQYHYRIEDQERIGPQGEMERVHRTMDEWNVDGARRGHGETIRRGRLRGRRPGAEMY